MNYKPPTSPVFWVPVPDIGQNRMKLIEWQLNPDKSPERMTLTDPEKGAYEVEILDFLGAYEMEQIPTHIARQIGGVKMTGKALFHFLKKRLPEFKNAEKVLFYQVNPITNG